MSAKPYLLALIAVYFLLWAWFSDWSFDQMIFWEGHGSNTSGALARVGVAFVLVVVAFVTALSPEDRR